MCVWGGGVVGTNLRGRSRIFGEGAPTSKVKAGTYYFDQFRSPKKLHENLKNGLKEARSESIAPLIPQWIDSFCSNFPACLKKGLQNGQIQPVKSVPRVCSF